MKNLIGIDIGGTKCAVSVATYANEKLDIIDRQTFPTLKTPNDTIIELINLIKTSMTKHNLKLIDSIGISCGGPLNSHSGVILSPPNLPDWDEISIVQIFKDAFKVPVFLQNDANACALAEWRWGAGVGTKNMIFLTFGTGLGAGLILNGRLYSGTNDMAGEIGHIRLASDGPYGYGKYGSFEGFCSGGGIANLARIVIRKHIEDGNPPAFCPTMEAVDKITAQDVGLAANSGDEVALNIFKTVGEKLGQGLAMIIDLLNPELIVIGSIYGRQKHLLEPIMMGVLKRESLSLSLNICDIKPAGLGEKVGDYASLSVAMQSWES